MTRSWRRLRVAALAAFGLLPGCTHMGWLPDNVNGAYGGKIDHLYFTIMAVVAVMFFLTEGALLYAILRFRATAGRTSAYSHGSKKAELLWSIVPGFVLLWLALAQKNTWFEIRDEFPPDSDAVVVQVMPEQFQWNFRYAGKDGKFGIEDAEAHDDIPTVGALHVPVGRNVVTRMSSKDVIHSFFLPHLRVKQDVLPGMMTRVWFRADRIGAWDLREQKLALLTPEEFERSKVALPASSIPERASFVLRMGVFDRATMRGVPFDDASGAGRRKNGQRDYWYDPPRVDAIEIAHQGKVETLPWGEAAYVLHPLDIACAELCGNNHWKMRGSLWIEPEWLFRRWLDEQAAVLEEYGTTPTSEKWMNVWDANHAAYNR